MSTPRLLGILLLVGGIICMVMAYSWSDSAGDQAKHFFTGEYRDKTMWLGVIGAIASVLGLAAIGLGFRGSSRR